MYKIQYVFSKYYKDINNVFFYTNSSNIENQNGIEYDELKILLSEILCEYVQKLEDYDEEIEELLRTLQMCIRDRLVLIVNAIITE